MPKPFLAQLASVDAPAPADENAAIESARLFTAYLLACRDEHRTLSLVAPGRFLMPGDLAGSPALTFAPLDVPAEGEPPAGSNWAMMHRRYDAYRDVVVRPFFRDHFARLDRQIVLVDALSAFAGGSEAVRDLQDALTSVLECFRVGRGGWLDALFPAERRPHPVRRDQGRPAASLGARPARSLPQAPHRERDRARRRRGRGRRRHRARRGARDARGDGEGEGGELPAIVGTAVPGEWSDGRHFDGKTEIALFPGDLPSGGLKGGDFRSIRFRPPTLEETDDGTPALPHIRLDRALQFLIGDRLR